MRIGIDIGGTFTDFSPVMDRYLSRLERESNVLDFRVMQSNGGSIRASQARREAGRCVLSGPAGGVVGARYVAEAAGFRRLLTFDMGGTSTDVSLCDGDIQVTTESEIGGVPNGSQNTQVFCHFSLLILVSK